MLKIFEDSGLTIFRWPDNFPNLRNREFMNSNQTQVHEDYCLAITKVIEAIITIWLHDEELNNMCCQCQLVYQYKKIELKLSLLNISNSMTCFF